MALCFNIHDVAKSVLMQSLDAESITVFPKATLHYKRSDTISYC